MSIVDPATAPIGKAIAMRILKAGVAARDM
jgi:hypothetical protein